MARRAQRDGVDLTTALLEKIECRRFRALDFEADAVDRLIWGVSAGMAIGAPPGSWPTASPFVTPMVAWEIWSRRWDCIPPTREEMTSVGLGGVIVDYAPVAHHQISLGVGADVLANFAELRARPLVRFGAGYLATGFVTPKVRVGLAAGPTFGRTGVGWGISLDAGFLAFDVSARVERAPGVMFVVVSIGMRDLHRYDTWGPNVRP